MTVFNTYSKKQKGLPTELRYDNIDYKFKNQVYHIWIDYFEKANSFDKSLKDSAIKEIFDTICKEEGLKRLYSEPFTTLSPKIQIERYFDNLNNTNTIIDVILIMFYYMKLVSQLSQTSYQYGPNYSIEEAINDLNTRFKENGLGYEFVNDEIIRVDNLLLHKETVQPVLKLLSESDYSNANEEYLKAHEHYRLGNNKECLNECLKAFETTMKIICSKNKWKYEKTDTAKKLIAILLSNKFIPNYNESQLNALNQQLVGSIPTTRNKNSGHGQGENKIVVPNSLATYMLYTTGATIQLLVETQKEVS